MRIAFVSRGNAVRSIMAEAIARKLFADAGLRAEVFSAGTEPEEEVDPLTIEVLKEKGYPTEGLFPKPLEKIPYKKLDILVTLCNEARERCEFVISHKRRENWSVEEPPKRAEAFRKTLTTLEELIMDLLKLRS